VKVLVTGSRDWETPQDVFDVLAALRPNLVIHGGCPTGADAFAEQWCADTGTPQDMHPADWGKHGRRAGYLRNKEMVDERPDLVVAFLLPGSKGTQMTIDLARVAGLNVRVYAAKTDR
jgi:hypothetical protein